MDHAGGKNIVSYKIQCLKIYFHGIHLLDGRVNKCNQIINTTRYFMQHDSIRLLGTSKKKVLVAISGIKQPRQRRHSSSLGLFGMKIEKVAAGWEDNLIHIFLSLLFQIVCRSTNISTYVFRTRIFSLLFFFLFFTLRKKRKIKTMRGGEGKKGGERIYINLFLDLMLFAWGHLTLSSVTYLQHCHVNGSNFKHNSTIARY